MQVLTTFCRLFLLSLLTLFLAGYGPRPAGAAGPEAALVRSSEQMARKEYRQAVETLHQALAAHPYSAELRRALAEGYFGLGMEHLQARRFADAASVLQEGTEYAGAEEGRFRLLRGYALFRAGDLGAAEGELNTARALTEDEPQVLELLGQVYYAGGRLHEALQVWEEALAKQPENGDLAARLEKTRRELRVEEAMERNAGGNFTISYDGAVHDDLGGQVLEALEEAYNEVGRDLGFYPVVEVPVLLYTQRDFAELTGAPDWAGGLYDGKIRIPVGGLTAMNDQLRAVLQHEYTHVALHYLTGGRCPLWLNEGLAEVAERRYFDPPLQALPAAAVADKLLPWSRIERSFEGLSPAEVKLAYEQSYSLVSFFIGQYGWHKMADVLAEIAAGRPAPEAIGRALADYAVDYDTFLTQWRARL